MKKYIAEDLPERKFGAPTSKPSGSAKINDPRRESGEKSKPVFASKDQGKTSDDKDKKEDKKKNPEEAKIRQAVYDIRYRARREDIPLPQAYSQYMQNSTLSSGAKVEVKNRLFKDISNMSENYNIDDLASTSLAKAMFKVFVENNTFDVNKFSESYLNEFKIATRERDDLVGKEVGGKVAENKYKVRVLDANGVEYIRYATRDKISRLRSNPEIKTVEITSHGKPYEGEAPDIEDEEDDENKPNNNVKNNKNNKNLKEGKKYKKTKDKPIDVMKGTNKVNINPNDHIKGNLMASNELTGTIITERAVSGAQQRFMGMVLAAKRGKMKPSEKVAKAAKNISTSEAEKIASTKTGNLPDHVKEDCGCQEEDPRSNYAKRNVFKNKLRSMGLKMTEPVITLDIKK